MAPWLQEHVWLSGLALIMGLSTPVLVACATHPPLTDGDAANYGFIQGSRGNIWVRGPWPEIRPSTDVDEVIDQLCPAILKLPRAQDRDYGQEYCGAIYSLGDGIYHASMPSPLSRLEAVGPSKRKSCKPPLEVRDARGRTSPIADFHSHPWAPSPMSTGVDTAASTQVWLIRIQFDTACHIQKLIPYRYEDRPGEIYERLGTSWKLIGYIQPEDKASGRITYVSEESP
jgi:hypothetical protein